MARRVNAGLRGAHSHRRGIDALPTHLESSDRQSGCDDSNDRDLGSRADLHSWRVGHKAPGNGKHPSRCLRIVVFNSRVEVKNDERDSQKRAEHDLQNTEQNRENIRAGRL